MRKISYSDFENEKELVAFFDSTFSPNKNHGFIRETNLENFNTFLKVFLDFLKSEDISITEADYIFNVNINKAIENSLRWEYLDEKFSNAGKETDILRKNVVYLFEASEQEKYVLNLNVVDGKYLISEIAGKFVIMGNTDFKELLSVWDKYSNIIDEILFFPEHEYDIPVYL